MNNFNAVLIFVFNFICILVFSPIATSAITIYDQIPPIDTFNPNGHVMFDILRDTDDFYPLGMITNPAGESREYIVDDLVTFGKEVTVVFGTKYVSLTPFARNIKLSARLVHLRYHVYIEYDLNGSKIFKKYYESGVAAPGQPRSFRFVSQSETGEVEEDDEDEDDDKPRSTGSDGSDFEVIKPQSRAFRTKLKQVFEFDDFSSDSDEDKKTKGEGQQDAAEVSLDDIDDPDVYSSTDIGMTTTRPDISDVTVAAPSVKIPEKSSGLGSLSGLVVLDGGAQPATDTQAQPETGQVAPITQVVTLPADAINVLDQNLSGKPGFQSADTVSGTNLTFRCVLFNNTNDVYQKLYFGNTKFNLSSKADAFEVCHTTNSTNNYTLMLSTQFSSIIVEQAYRSIPNGMEPLSKFDPFVGLKSYSERRLPGDSDQSAVSGATLDMNTLEPGNDSPYEKITTPKCSVYRYKDGLEDGPRIGEVTKIKFGNSEYDVPAGNRFVMVSRCEPYLSTYYVVIMIKDFFQYQSLVFHSSDNQNYRERKFLEDEERLDLINLTSKIWHKRQSSGPMGDLTNPVDDEVEVLCLNQFTKGPQSQPKHCKPVNNLSNFKLLYHGDDFTNVVYKKQSPKSAVFVGNSIFDLNRDDNDKYIYISHPPKEPVSVLVVNTNSENVSIGETGFGTNAFHPVVNSLYSLKQKPNKKDLNFALYRSNLYGITWDYNDYMKKHYLFASKFPEYCMGDLTFHNMKITSAKQEGYKQITTLDRQVLTEVTITIMLPNNKMVLGVTIDGKRSTTVDLKSPKAASPTTKHEEL